MAQGLLNLGTIPIRGRIQCPKGIGVNPSSIFRLESFERQLLGRQRHEAFRKTGERSKVGPLFTAVDEGDDRHEVLAIHRPGLNVIGESLIVQLLTNPRPVQPI